MARLLKLLAGSFGLREGKTSSIVAKDRLKLILLHDHLSISPVVIEKMRKELIEVISKYVNVDTGGIKMELEEDEDLAVLVANIPIGGGRQKAAAAGKK